MDCRVQIVWFCVGLCTVRRHLPAARAVSREISGRRGAGNRGGR